MSQGVSQAASPPVAPAPAPFVSIPLRPRFFQASAFFPMPVVLLATMNADGTPNLAPYSLCFPHVTAEGHRLALVMRQASKTAENLVRTGRVSVSFIPDRPELLANCKVLAQPVSSADKMARSIFSLVPSPRAEGPALPPLVGEAVQVFECRLVSSEVAFEASEGDALEHRFVLEVDAIWMAPRWAEVLESGGRGPRLPVDYGFRRGSATWMSRPGLVTSGPRIRPVFEVEVDRPPERVIAEFKAALAQPDAPIVGKIRGEVLQLGLPRDEVTTWSPSVDLRVDPSPGGPGGAVVRGRVGPQPQVWTTFMFFHMMIALIGLGGLMWGIAALTAGESGWPMWIAAGAVFMHAFVAGAAFIGQGLGADQTYKLRSFIEDVLGP